MCVRVCQQHLNRPKWKIILYFVTFLLGSQEETRQHIRRRTQRKIYSFLTDDAFIVLVSGECLIAQILQSKTKVEKKTQ